MNLFGTHEKDTTNNKIKLDDKMRGNISTDLQLPLSSVELRHT